MISNQKTKLECLSKQLFIEDKKENLDILPAKTPVHVCELISNKQQDQHSICKVGAYYEQMQIFQMQNKIHI